MKERKLYPIVCLGLFCFVIPAVGCDQLKGVKDKITGDEKTTVQPAVSAPLPQAASAASPAAAVMGPDTLARVGNWTITKKEFDERLSALKEVLPEFDITALQNRKDVLEELVRQQLIVLDAERSGFANQADIKAAIDEFRRTLIVREIAMQKTRDIKVSEEEAMKIYEENKDVLVEPLKLRVRELVVKEKEKAEGLLIQILQGGDFAELAKTNSVSASAENGGDLGYLEEAPFPQMGNQLVTLEQGDVSSVFSGPDGYYIVKVEEKAGGTPLEFSEIKDMIIEQQTLMNQQQVVLEYIERLRKEFPVEINENLLK